MFGLPVHIGGSIGSQSVEADFMTSIIKVRQDLIDQSLFLLPPTEEPS